MRYYFFILFLFFVTYVYSYERTVMIKSRVGGYWEVLRKFFYLSSEWSEEDKYKHFLERSLIITEARDLPHHYVSECLQLSQFLLLFFKSYFSFDIKFNHVFFCVFEIPYDIWLFYLSFLTCLNKIPARPQLCKNTLNNDNLPAWGTSITEKHVIF